MSTIIVEFQDLVRNTKRDLQVPLDMSAGNLIEALTEAYQLGIDMSDATQKYLQSENPIALIQGERTLKDLGLHDGSTILFVR
ncbi:MAG: EsaB/YukD family protein [Clostridia bacterium]|nr:EsaB/YukD family protein [Clostridia bacterium]